MLVECKKCGAPLDVEGAERFTTCRYCGAKNKVKQMRTIAMQTPPDWHAPTSWQQPAVPPPSTRARGRSGMVTGLVFLAISAAGALFAVRMSNIAMTMPSGGSSLGTLLAPLGPRVLGVGCLVHANDDKVFDLAVLTGESATPDLRILDGNTGAQIGLQTRISDDAVLACASDDQLAVFREDGKVAIYTARSLALVTEYVTDTADPAQQIGMGNGCLRIKHKDGSFTGVALNGGARVDCPLAEGASMRSSQGRLVEHCLMRNDVETGWKELHFTLGFRPQGIQYLQLRAERERAAQVTDVQPQKRRGRRNAARSTARGREELWQRQLDHVCVGGGIGQLSMVVARGTLVVAGSPRGATNEVALLGIDAATGQTRFTVSQPPGSGTFFGGMAYNGAHVLAYYGGKVRAHDPQSGGTIWEFGQ